MQSQIMKPMAAFYKDADGKLCKLSTDTYATTEEDVEPMRKMLDEELPQIKPVLILIQGGKQDD